jgi:hypothetical protein
VRTKEDRLVREAQLKMLRFLAKSPHARAEAFREMLARMSEFDDRLLTEKQAAWVADAYRSQKARKV